MPQRRFITGGSVVWTARVSQEDVIGVINVDKFAVCLISYQSHLTSGHNYGFTRAHYCIVDITFLLLFLVSRAYNPHVFPSFIMPAVHTENELAIV